MSRRERILRSNPQKGSNQLAVRSYNERLILHLVRKHGILTKAEAARATGLSANAISVIFRALEAETLLVRGEPIRGKVGQPSTPISLNPAAKHYLGLKIGRRSFDLVVIDFVGNVLAVEDQIHPFPTPEGSVRFAHERLGPLLEQAGLTIDRIDGFGIAMPNELWGWTSSFGAPADKMAAWRDFDVRNAFRDLGPWDLRIDNDATAACGAELTFGNPSQSEEFIYLFIGTLIGGGLVFNSSVFRGRTGRAGGFGPMRIPGGEHGAERLLDHASLFRLEDSIGRAGGDPVAIYRSESIWHDFPAEVDAWISETAKALTYAIISSVSVVDVQNVIIDGAFPEPIRQRLTDQVRAEIASADLLGVTELTIEPGHWGGIARAVGAATLPLAAEYMINQNTLLREA